ncbi:MAG: membrane integrity-associated transporter subunit PqiC [Desulfobacteraceae bacterium]|nr:membrane integrity-associated transporter subunit PqiC [Desulfobacteraceae bacterium]MBC2757555.1 membrane integrity-associated transporter subunit PqiC [Desulfobacteraceae bacterium]
MMKLDKLYLISGIFIFLGLFCFFGCRSSTLPSAFYTLAPMAEITQPDAYASLPDITIGVGPVKLPEYLNRPQIVTRSGPHRIDLSEFNRWGGLLDQDILKVMFENLSVFFPKNRILQFPWGADIRPDYRISIDIRQFDGKTGGAVKLKAIWTLRNNQKEENTILTRQSIIEQPVTGTGYEGLVAALSQSLAELSKEIVLEIQFIENDAE